MAANGGALPHGLQPRQRVAGPTERLTLALAQSAESTTRFGVAQRSSVSRFQVQRPSRLLPLAIILLRPQAEEAAKIAFDMCVNP